MAELYLAALLVSHYAWAVVRVLVAVAAMIRLGRTPAGLVLAASLLTSAVKSVAAAILQQTVLAGLPATHPTAVAVYVVTSGVSMVALLGVAAGIALIPSSLRQRAGANLRRAPRSARPRRRG